MNKRCSVTPRHWVEREKLTSELTSSSPGLPTRYLTVARPTHRPNRAL